MNDQQTSKYDLKQLNKELEDALINFNQYHRDMDTYRNYYLNSVFYAPKSGEVKQKSDIRNNLLRVFSDKNIHFTSAEPTTKVPTTGASPEQRQAASMREKVILAVRKKSGTAQLQKKWAKDATILSVAVAETGFDIQERCAFVRRYDPRYCLWQLSNGNDNRVTAFWAVYPITKDEAKSKYGVEPTSQPIASTALTDQYLHAVDGKDWFLMAIRWDDTHRVAWVGDRLIEEPHSHMMGGIPVDICMPFEDNDSKGFGSFYIEPMLSSQAELNHTIKKRSNIVARQAEPLVWGRGIVSRQLDEVKSGMKNGGFVGLKQGGELGILQLNDVKLLNEHAEECRQDMMRLSGFSAAAMGELAGANTSGDALGMYFTPTQRHIEYQNVSWIAFHESINAKILCVTEKFAKTGETFKLSGYSPRGTIQALGDNADQMTYSRSSGYEVEFDPRSVINGNFSSVVIMKAITPKNEIEEKRLLIDAVDRKFISRTTAYEEYGLESPEDEFALLSQEQQDPAMNPDGMAKLISAASSMTEQPGAPAGAPAPPAPAAIPAEV